jgi:predicted site-specific integrase-resolvase
MDKAITLLTRQQLAEQLGCSVGTIDNYTKRGILRPRRITSRCIRFVWEEVEQDLNLQP